MIERIRENERGNRMTEGTIERVMESARMTENNSDRDGER